MTDDFFSYVSTLPKAFSKEEQDAFLREFTNLREDPNRVGNSEIEKNYDAVREILIEHNLRLCSDFAIKYCKKNGIMKDVEDIFGECVIALTKALNEYDINKGFNLSSMAYKYMSTHLINTFIKSDADASSRLQNESSIYNKDEEILEEGLLGILVDPEESKIAEDTADKA